MQIENQLQVADARDKYLNWNLIQFNRLIDTSTESMRSVIQLLPLLLHTNNRHLPGFLGLEVPSGVYSYVPDNAALHEARLLNNKFQHHDEGIIKKSSIDAIYFQTSLISYSQKCWIFINPDLDISQIGLLKDKIDKIASWITARGVNIELVCLTREAFRNYPKYRNNENLSIYLDFFYGEIVILAGKYPVWWLVPPEKDNEYEVFVEHIKQVRFVEEDEFIDLGGISDLTKIELLRYAVNQVKTVKKSPDICLVRLLISSQRSATWPIVDGVSVRLKNMLYQSAEDIQPLDVVVDIMNDSFGRYYDINESYKPGRIFSKLKNVSGALNQKLLDAFLGDTYYQEAAASGIDSIISYLNLFKAISSAIKHIFAASVESFNEGDADSEDAKSLSLLANNMLVYLSENADRVPLYNNKDKNDIIFDRIQLKHEIINDNQDSWSLILQEANGNEKSIEGFSCLLGLLAWCWLNRVVNYSTQVSINCPLQQIKQTEAFYVLETLMRKIDPQLLLNIPAVAFENPVRPIQSMLFVNFMAEKRQKHYQFSENDDPLSFGNASTNLVTHCEQLIINSLGDVYTKEYAGDMGVLECLCEWTHHAPVDSLSRPQQFEVFGHGTGESTYMAQRVNEVYKAMIEYFYQRSDDESRFLLRLASDFYVVTAIDRLLLPEKIGSKKNLLDYLEAPHGHFVSTTVESRAFAEEPLRAIYQSNKENVLQVFFRINNRSASCWVVDEKGSLWRDVIEQFDKDSFITHWLYLFKNLRNRLKSASYQEKELPTLEIKQVSINQLGGLEFYAIGADSISSAKNFFDVQVSIQGDEAGERLSLFCDGRKFSYDEFGTRVLTECVDYIDSRIDAGRQLPVFVTDIDAPLKLFNISQRDEMQTNRILKMKRNFERRIRQLLGA